MYTTQNNKKELSMDISGVYHPRNPESSPLWKLMNDHFDSFERNYEEKFEKQYGFYRPVISEVVREYLKCGDLKEGFARVRCPDCGHEYLLAFSCHSRWFCPSCHAKKVIQFGELLKDTILYPIPHRQYVFTIPIMLRVYFKHDRRLLTKLCRCAYDSLLIFLRNVIGLREGVPGVVMSIQTFGDYPDKFHPHIHMISSDGLFNDNGTFYVMPDVDLKPLEELFRAEVFKMLKKEEKITDEIINLLLSWKHSGFSVHNRVRVERDDVEYREKIRQYIIRNTFSLEKLTYNAETGTVIYHSKMTHGNSKKNFQVYTAEEFIAAITQHIPEKSFQMVRYYGWYSNKSRGIRLKQGIVRPGDEPLNESENNVEIIDVSDYQPKRIPSKTWRECIKKVWEIDPLSCPRCNGEMKIIAFITDDEILFKILDHLGLCSEKPSRAPPDNQYSQPNEYFNDETVVREPFDDGWPVYDEEPCLTLN